MARVCREEFPETDGFYMDDGLKVQIDVMIKNVIKDWDFTILISGQGEMRVGKSLIGLQIGYYWTSEMKRKYGIVVPFNVKENVAFNGADLVPKGMKLGNRHKYAVIDYDEAADDMEGTKVNSASAKYVKDYMRKAAQFNMLNIIIQSEFFEVPKYLAISRSICLIDVAYFADEEGNFKRGYFRFYSRHSKKKLYLIGKKLLDYGSVKPDFRGTFPNFYPINQEEYREEKRKSLMTWGKVSMKEKRREEWLKGMMSYAHRKKEEGGLEMSYLEIAKTISQNCKIPVSDFTVRFLLSGEGAEEDD